MVLVGASVFAISVVSHFRTPLLPAIGSFPIWRDGALIGAMGASGGSAELDEEAVSRAIRAIGGDIQP